ncbi:unnamed protein product [Closterium sp. Naga37s-1]|nr:unnamed protein product [Closterium sp. Naga37s-1]
MRYMSADYRVSANQLDPWQVSGSHSWDSMPFLGWPVKNQKDCNASWAYAVVASVEAAYGIALNQQAPQLSVDSLFAAMGLTSPAAKCMAGGSPAVAFAKLLTLPRGGLTTDGKRGFERTRFKGYVGLLLAVQRQPVVVHIEASAATFIEYDGDPTCYTGNLNHAVLIVGYLVSTTNARQSPMDVPFWIIRNSWGVEWGDRGHMRMDIQGANGVCGINVLPGIYPIVKTNTTTSTLNITGANWWCSDVFPAVGLALASVPVQSMGDTCSSITAQIGLAETELASLNPGLNCSQPIKAGHSLCLERNATFAFTVPRCLQYGMLTAQDTCEDLLLQGMESSEDDSVGPLSGDASVGSGPWIELYRNNPGLICPRTIHATSSTVSSVTSVQVCLKAEH